MLQKEEPKTPIQDEYKMLSIETLRSELSLKLGSHNTFNNQAPKTSVAFGGTWIKKQSNQNEVSEWHNKVQETENLVIKLNKNCK